MPSFPRNLCLVILLHLQLANSARPSEAFSLHSSIARSPRISHPSFPRGGGNGPSVPSASSASGDNVGAKLEPIGKALVELAVATWTFTKYLFDHQIRDPKTHIVEPLQQRLNKVLGEKKNEDAVADITTEEDTIDKSFLKGHRVVRLSLVAWILSEALDLMGILHEDTPRLLKSQVDRVWYDVQPKLMDALNLIHEWWSRAMTTENFESIPSKYNFALGTSIGMIVAPLLSAVMGTIARPLILVYSLAEGNAFLQRRGQRGLVDLLDTIHSGIGHGFGRVLERFRRIVRSAMPQPVPIDGALILTTGGSRFDSIRGTLVQQRHYRRSYLFPWRKVQISKALVNSNQDGKGPIHPMVAMIRHGFVVGSAIGFFLRT
ncbi:unnamed protein product [Cylindrotheca closterium]|uniref:Uncharacterized protein n=1 Tax=Cylindrotheca closterium TaxID=2856 RepID=A0AAD2FM90_9STRA|nr:unnamed protein product [Cylindrotheca closterium]